MSIQSLCIHRVTVQKETITQGAGMGKIRAWTNTKSNFPCRVCPKESEQTDRLSKEGEKQMYDVYSYLDFAADESHRLVWVDPKTKVTHYLYVRDPRNPHALGRYYLVRCEEMRDVDNVRPA